MTQSTKPPCWDDLYAVALAQEGQFTTQQAAEVGYSPQLLLRHLANGRLVRLRRGVYRLVHFPDGATEQLTTLWLWSGREGVFSHDTALALFELSDILPSQVHLTLPPLWRRRRIHVPAGLILHHADISASDRTWYGAVPVTTPRRTLHDCVRDHLSPDLLRQAASQALHRGLLSARELPPGLATDGLP